MEFEAFDFLTGVVATLLAVKLYVLTQCRHYVRRLLGNLVKGRTNAPKALQPSMQPQTIPADWIKSGSPVFQTFEFAQASDNSASGGIWSCEGPSAFEWQFGCDEWVLVLEGRVEIDYQGQHFVLEAGSSALFYAGTRALWNVPKYVRKSYVLHQPNFMVRAARRLMGAVRG